MREEGWMSAWACECSGFNYADVWGRKIAKQQTNYQSIHTPHIVSDMDPDDRVNM